MKQIAGIDAFSDMPKVAASVCWLRSLALCFGIALAGTSWAQDGKSQPSEDPVLVGSPDPGYYMRLAGMKPGQTGTAHIQACIDAKGRITSSALSASSGHPALDGAAIAVVSLSQFRAGIVKGKPKAKCAVLPVSIAAPATAEEFARLPERLPNRTWPQVVSKPEDIMYGGPVSDEDLAKGGRVIVLICNDDAGRIISTTVLESSASPKLSPSALKTARQYRLAPARENGKPMGSCTTLPVVFPPLR